MSDLQWALNETPISSSKANKLGVPKWTTATRDAKADADLVVGMLIWNVTTNKLQKLKQLTPSRIWVDILDMDDRGVANGVASLDGSTKVPLAQLQEVLGLTDLSNVTITLPADKQILEYEVATSLWKNKPAAAGPWETLIDETISGDPANTSTFTAKKFLKVYVYWTTTIFIGYVSFNNDLSSLYASRWLENGTSSYNFLDRGIQVHRSGPTADIATFMEISNYNDKHKRCSFSSQIGAYNGANTSFIGVGVYGSNTQVTRITLDDYNAGTVAARVRVVGHD